MNKQNIKPPVQFLPKDLSLWCGSLKIVDKCLICGKNVTHRVDYRGFPYLSCVERIAASFPESRDPPWISSAASQQSPKEAPHSPCSSSFSWSWHWSVCLFQGWTQPDLVFHLEVFHIFHLAVFQVLRRWKACYSRSLSRFKVGLQLNMSSSKMALVASNVAWKWKWEAQSVNYNGKGSWEQDVIFGWDCMEYIPDHYNSCRPPCPPPCRPLWGLRDADRIEIQKCDLLRDWPGVGARDACKSKKQRCMLWCMVHDKDTHKEKYKVRQTPDICFIFPTKSSHRLFPTNYFPSIISHQLFPTNYFPSKYFYQQVSTKNFLPKIVIKKFHKKWEIFTFSK